MLALFLEETGQLHDETHALAVGAGDERIVFWLANRLGRVVATDIYGEGDFAGREAHSSMLDDPAAHAPFAFRGAARVARAPAPPRRAAPAGPSGGGL